jgi:hypothetical protein
MASMVFVVQIDRHGHLLQKTVHPGFAVVLSPPRAAHAQQLKQGAVPAGREHVLGFVQQHHGVASPFERLQGQHQASQPAAGTHACAFVVRAGHLEQLQPRLAGQQLGVLGLARAGRAIQHDVQSGRALGGGMAQRGQGKIGESIQVLDIRQVQASGQGRLQEGRKERLRRFKWPRQRGADAGVVASQQVTQGAVMVANAGVLAALQHAAAAQQAVGPVE